ncbi:MAG: hypothetical protein IJT50_07035 [Lentisphaeria bacterium]|nr:hypothetical protein [Lentisphaeria bacterium]
MKKFSRTVPGILAAPVLFPLRAVGMVLHGVAVVLHLFWDSFVIGFLQNGNIVEEKDHER